MERFGLGHLLEDQLLPPSAALYWLLGALFLISLLIALYAYVRAFEYAPDGSPPPLRPPRFTAWAAGFSAFGLAATLWSWLTVPWLSKRLWLVIALAGLLASILTGVAAGWRQRGQRQDRHAGDERGASVPSAPPEPSPRD